MYKLRHIIQRLRLGETDRSIAKGQSVGRRTVARIRAMAVAQGWLSASSPLPDDAAIAAHNKASGKTPNAGTAKVTQNTSTIEPWRADVLAWHQQGIAATAIRQALSRTHGFTVSNGMVAPS